MNILLKNINAVLLKEGKYTVEETDIYISGNKIISIGKPVEGYRPNKLMDCKGKFAIPGFVNAHTHAYMSVFRNSADDLSFDDWLFGTILPMEDKLTGEDAYWGTMLSCIEMVKTGTTSFVDMHLFPHYVAKATADSGMRAVLTRGLVGEDDRPDGMARIDQAMADIHEFRDNPRITFMLAPHAPYTCNDGYLKICAEKAQELGVGINIHLSESENEIKGIAQKYGCTPIELMERVGIFENKTIGAHCVNLTEHDMELLKKYNVTVATNPVSNMKLANGFAPIPELVSRGINVALGTDSSASNNSLNMISELKILTLIHKGTHKDAEVISARDGFKMATQNGAIGMGYDNLGLIEEGYLADIAIMNLNYPWFKPESDLVSAIAYSATGAEFETVIVDGNILMENGKITFADEREVYKRCEEIIKRVR